MHKQLGAAVLIAALAGCGGGATGQAQNVADTMTKAAYANDMATFQSQMDDAHKADVTRAQIGAQSDAMHKLGDYKGLTFLSSDPAKNEYTYRADFTNGSMTVTVHLDSSGQAAGYLATTGT